MMSDTLCCERIGRVVKNGNTIGITGRVIPIAFLLLSTLTSLRDRDRDRDCPTCPTATTRDREEVSV